MIECLLPKWTSPIYAFYKPVPEVEHVEMRDGRVRIAHTFTCYNKGCTKRIRRFLDTSDRMSTSNLRDHAISCWGKSAVDAARDRGTAKDARDQVTTPLKRDSDIKLALERKGKGKITYSMRAHTNTETRAECVHWMVESFRPFALVEDDGFKRLMKTGRPEHYLPSRSTVSRDVKRVFVQTRSRIAQWLQEYEGDLNFQTDCWTSPNHKAYMGTTVTLEHNGSMMTFVLNVVEVSRVCPQSTRRSRVLTSRIVPFWREPGRRVYGDACRLWHSGKGQLMLYRGFKSNR
ncbi:hypothetical protein EV714DRAFT_222565 [Schizophyllum commune]